MIKAASFLGVLVILGCTQSKPPQEKPKEMTASDFVSRVVSTLAEGGRSGSLIYEGVCTSSEAIVDTFKVGASQRNAPAVRALQQAFANEPRLSEKEEASGRIRILGGNVHTDLLDLRIPQISFHSEDNPRDAVAALVTLPEVKAYMQSHGIKFVNAIGGIAPMPKGAHLNTMLRNVTVSEALDRIAQTFPGVWIYSECVTESQRRLVDFTFIEF